MAMPTAREQTDYLRWRTYLLASREPFKPRTALPLRPQNGSAPRARLRRPYPQPTWRMKWRDWPASAC